VDPRQLDAALKKILALKRISWVSEGTSNIGFYLRVEFVDRTDLRDFVFRKISNLPGIQDIQVFQILEERGKSYI
jgi:hypothetical protein